MDLGLDVSEVDGWTVLTVTGEVDVATAPKFRERLVALVAGGHTRLVIDLTPTQFLDSTGLGVLVGTLKRIREADGALALVVPQDRLLRLFDITGLSKVFAIFATCDDALSV